MCAFHPHAWERFFIQKSTGRPDKILWGVRSTFGVFWASITVLLLIRGGIGMEITETWVEDDRVLCGQCDNANLVDCRQSMPAEQMEKHRKVNAKPLQWMFDVAKVKNGWATVTWKEWQCQATGMSTQPLDLKHRCHLYSKATVQPSSVKSDAWWID
jgi:hypothetical protein